MMKERIQLFERGVIIGIGAIGLIAIGFCSFPREIRNQVRKEQEGICAWCGNKPKVLEVHHIIPSSLGGKNIIGNAIGLCHECHQKADTMAGVRPQK